MRGDSDHSAARHTRFNVWHSPSRLWGRRASRPVSAWKGGTPRSSPPVSVAHYGPHSRDGLCHIPRPARPAPVSITTPLARQPPSRHRGRCSSRRKRFGVDDDGRPRPRTGQGLLRLAEHPLGGATSKSPRLNAGHASGRRGRGERSAASWKSPLPGRARELGLLRGRLVRNVVPFCGASAIQVGQCASMTRNDFGFVSKLFS